MEKEIIIASKYRVIRKIGEGGTAKVYLAYDTIFERNVALKILKKENGRKHSFFYITQHHASN